MEVVARPGGACRERGSRPPFRRAFLTGGTGFIGAHVARALLGRGAAVRCLVRPESRRDNLDGLGVEAVEGDLTDYRSLREAVEGCDAVFHCAADYRLWAPDPSELYRTNVQGTRNVLRAAAESGIESVVHTSSVGALGLTRDGTPADETTPVRLSSLIGHYKRSKFLAERVVEEWTRRGLRVFLVNPAAPVGELDIKPTPTGRVIVDFLNGRIPAYVDTGLNVVDVHDVAEGHLLAAERGRPGRRYILGNRNLTLRQILEILSAATGLPRPRLRLPHWAPLLYAAAEGARARRAGRPPRVTLEGVRMARKRMYFDSGRAVRELGLPQSPVEEAVGRAVEWFRRIGYAPA
ncbi:MAG: hopanoid-associated sugar epimerase [Gemmatimonadota bacterium]